MEIQIKQISNGWLLVLPPPQSVIIQAMNAGQQVAPVLRYCQNWSDVLDFIGEDPSKNGASAESPSILR